MQRYVREDITRIHAWTEVGLMLREPAKVSIPTTQSYHHLQSFKPAGRWDLPTRVARFKQTRKLKRYDLFFSSSSTQSPQGAPEVLTIHNMNVELHPQLCGTWGEQ